MGEPFYLSLEQIRKLTPLQLKYVYFRDKDRDDDYAPVSLTPSELFARTFAAQGYPRELIRKLWAKMQANNAAKRQTERSRKQASRKTV